MRHFLFVVAILSCSHLVRSASLNAEGRIRAALLTAATYDRWARPYTNESDRKVTVSIDVALQQIMQMDDQEETMSTALWVRVRWTDKNLVWNSTVYDGVTTIRASKDEIWTPDLAVYNDVRTSILDITQYPLSITNDGSVKWLYPLMLKSACKPDITWFPYDQQICKILFGSWTYTGTDLDLVNYTTTGDLANLIPNNQWDVITFELRRHNVYYGCCPDPYPDVTYYIIMRRKSLHYIMTLVVPCVVLMFISIWGFYLPPASGERMTLVITNLLAMVVFFMVARDSLPLQSDTIPLIEKYFAGALGLLSISVIMFIISLQLYHRGIISDSKPPQWVRYLCFNILAPALCLLKIYKVKKTGTGCCGDSTQVDVEPADAETDHDKENGTAIATIPDEKQAADAEKNEEMETELEWQIISIVIDRVFMVLIALTYFILSLSILLYQPYYNMDPESKTTY